MAGDPIAAATFLFPQHASPPLHTHPQDESYVDTGTARVLVLSTPTGLERMVRDCAVPAVGPTLPPHDAPRPAPDDLARIFEAHGQVNLGPPLGPND
jgi:hypothetical protein